MSAGVAAAAGAPSPRDVQVTRHFSPKNGTLVVTPDVSTRHFSPVNRKSPSEISGA